MWEVEINKNKIKKINLESKETQTINNEEKKEENEFQKSNNNNDEKIQINELNKNNNINEINHKLNWKKKYEGKDRIINNIIKEDNNKDNHKIQKEKKIKKYKEYKEYNIDVLKHKKQKIEEFYVGLYNNVIGNKELDDLNINVIISKEILKYENNISLIQIILMDEESSKKFQTFINYKKINEFINSGDKTKEYLIEKNHKEFNKIYNIIDGNNIELPNEIKLIDEYKDCKKIMNLNKKVQLMAFDKFLFKKIFNKGKNIFIYYFTNKNNYFIFFPKDKKIFKLKYPKNANWDNLFYLEEYIEN